MTRFPIDKYASRFTGLFGDAASSGPWVVTQSITALISALIPDLDDDYIVRDDVAIHQSATIEHGAVIKGPVIIGEACFIGAHAYLRGGVYLAQSVRIGPGCEIKSSIVLPHSSIAHFNFIGDSIIGSHVNFEAGAVIANHHNDRTDKNVFCMYEGKKVDTGMEKFGALVGDFSKIGANAVLSPGTIVPTKSIIKRLELIDQMA